VAHIFFSVILTAFALSCKSGPEPKTLGAAAPVSTPLVTLSEVASNPAAYDGKNVLMQGIVSGQCASLCEFTYKEGTEAALIFPQGFSFPKLKVGGRVKMYARITKGEEQIVISALGLQQL
jgi:hypothetical protein